MLTMEVQRGFAHDRTRGQIATNTRAFSALGVAIATFIDPLFLLQDAAIKGGVLAAGTCLLLLSGLAVPTLRLGGQEYR